MDVSKITNELKVSARTEETIDAFSLSFEIPSSLKEKFKYKAGQFVSLFLNIDGKEATRSYSLSSSPDLDSDFKISIKRVPGGLVSNYLADKVKVGSTLRVTPPAGRFVLPNDLNNKTLVFFAAGSGITPVVSMIKTALHKSSTVQVYLLYCNRDESSIMFHHEISELNSKYEKAFTFEYLLTQPQIAWQGRSGRVHAALIQDYLKQNKLAGLTNKNYSAYLCGPEGFMATVEAALELNGFGKDQIHIESFVSPGHPNENPSEASVSNSENSFIEEVGADAVFIGDKSVAKKPKTIEAHLSGEVIKLAAKDGQSVLETLLEAGHSPPYSCMDGACMACLGKVKSGLVYQNDMGILTEDNIEIRECLTCQAKPASENVVIDYDF